MDCDVSVAGIALKDGSRPVEGGCVEIDGEPFYCIANYDAMPPFFMSLVSESDHWLFISSNGALTAGRRDPDHALFPYYTDDRIHDSQDQTGSVTVLRVARSGKTWLWEPFSRRFDGLYRVSRRLMKSAYGNKIIFEETNHDLSMTFSYAWMTSERFGFVRRAALANHGRNPAAVEILDGIQNVMPYGLTNRFQLMYSTLADGYRESELEAETGLGLFKLSSIPMDKAEPSEALRVTTVWCGGLQSRKTLLSVSQIDRFRCEGSVLEETEVRGRRGAYLVSAGLALPSNCRREWHVVADVNQDAANVKATLQALRGNGDLAAEVERDVARGTENLVRIAASSDGLQLTEDHLATWRHFSNTLFNVMRGGVPDDGYRISRQDLESFVRNANRRVAEEQRDFFTPLPETILHGDLLALARGRGDPDLERLTHEYLPLTFSRRHGDPSRPWNNFAIEVKDEHGLKIRNYQGNWRDIFQNWEALCLSFPGYIESMIFKFVDASTADGYNPYRITREGFDWEVINPHDAWSFIGYWGDHQVIYLLKLLEESTRYHPDALDGLLSRAVFTYANVPYRIKGYDAMLENPRKTIEFAAARSEEILARAARMGAEGKSLSSRDGSPYRVNLTEKLLLLVLTRLSNYIPEAGIWMNTQRPEWNDANNALVGYGVSMVTLYYLRRFLAFSSGLFASAASREMEISEEVFTLFQRTREALLHSTPLLDGPISDRDRKAVLDLLGKAGSDYRSGIYSRGFSEMRVAVNASELEEFSGIALRHVDHSIRANRRPDGLYHSYNVMRVIDGQRIAIRRLSEMLEGQVAVLSSGALSPEESAALLDTLRSSRLYREDQNSYLLYPDRRLPRFLEKNRIPGRAVEKSKLLREMLGKGDRRIAIRDVEGEAHFNGSFRNAELLREALEGLKGEYGPLVEDEGKTLLELYEQVFDHESFTGRSGAFFKYEGLGCVYWHMVSKLALAVHEVLARAIEAGASAETVDSLRTAYRDIREGIGVHKSPRQYGAIPTDPYSHTPGFAGAQQPGMTGQVKEDIITRLGEMGVRIVGGRISFDPALVARDEFLKNPARFRFFDLEGARSVLELGPGTLAFTICQVPVVLHLSGGRRIEVRVDDGSLEAFDGLELDAETSTAIFQRTGKVKRMEVFFDFSG